MRSPRHTIAAALLAAVALSACDSDKPDPTSAPTTAAAGATPSTAPGAPATDSELEALLVSTVPAGFVVQPDDVGDTGPSDLAKAMRDDGTAGAEALRSEGFVRGYQRLWIGPGDAEIIVFVYQFENESGAAAENRRTTRELTGQEDTTPFTVEGIPGATAITGSSADISAAIVAFPTGVYNVQIVCNGPALAGLQSRVSTIARDQFDRL